MSARRPPIAASSADGEEQPVLLRRAAGDAVLLVRRVGSPNGAYGSVAMTSRLSASSNRNCVVSTVASSMCTLAWMCTARPGVPARVDGQELDDAVVVGDLRAAQERRARAVVVVGVAVGVGGVVAVDVAVPDLDGRAGDRHARLVDDLHADPQRQPGVALGDVAPLDLLDRRERALRQVGQHEARARGPRSRPP